MSSIRVSGNTSGYYDLTVPDVAGQNTIPLDQLVTTDTNGNLGIGTSNPVSDPSGAFGWSSPVVAVDGTRPTLYLNGSDALTTIRMWPSGDDGSSTTLDDWHINTIKHSNGGFIKFAPQGGALGNAGLSLKNNGNVGINRSTPQSKFEVWTGNGELSHFGSNNANATNNYTGISLGYAEAGANSNYRKVGIVAVGRADSAARQDLAFLVDSNADGNSIDLGDTKMRISHEGYVTTPSQPAFRAYLSTEWSTISAYVNSGWTNQYNRGNCFNQGTFTAPVDGVYNFTVAWDALSTQSQLNLDRNGSYAGGFRYEPTGRTDNSWETHSYSVQTQLNANDYVKLYLDGGGGSNPIHMGGNQWGFFAGYLVG